MATSVATGSPLPENGALRGSLDVDADALIEQSRQLAATPLGDRDRLASLLLGGSFLTVAVTLAALAHSSRQVGLLTVLVFVASYALASRIDFEIGTGSAVPAQLAQFAFDFGSTALRDRLGLGVSPWSLLRFMVWIWAVDCALTPISVLAALGCGAHP